MGQQQLLLLLLSVILVGIAMAVGISLFTSNAIDQKRNEVINECVLLASEAQLYFRKPISLGGGGKSFVGWKVPPQYSSTAIGSFKVSGISKEEVKITGTGNDVVTGNDSVKVIVTVTPLTYLTQIIH